MASKTSRKAAKKAGKAEKKISKYNKFERTDYVFIVLKKVYMAHTSRLSYYNKRSLTTIHEIQTAVSLLLPIELTKHAVTKWAKAVTKYTSSFLFKWTTYA